MQIFCLPEQQQQKIFHCVQTHWWFKADDSEKRTEMENLPELGNNWEMLGEGAGFTIIV